MARERASSEIPYDSPIRHLLEQGRARGGSSLVDFKRFKQRLDHFDPTNDGTFEQRYFVNATGWSGQKDAPKFIFMGGEANVEFFNFQEVQALKWAAEFGAKYIQLEHRFYGESRTDVVMTPKEMRFLTIDQALADAANFMVSYDEQTGENGKWIVVGCSYSAALAVFMRERYPTIVHASVAPSGPLLAQNNYTSFFGHFESAAGPQCASAVRAASARIYALSQTSAGLAQLSSTFSTCDALDSSNSWYFLNSLMSNLGSADQFDNPPSAANAPWPLQVACNDLLANGSSVDNVIAQWARWQLGTERCMFVNERELRAALAVPAPSSSRSWDWQKCVDGFGWFKSSYEGTSVFFPNQDVEHLISYCGNAFGSKFAHPDNTRVNAVFGGLEPLTDNVMVTNGLRDPWSLVSLRANPPLPSGVRAVTYDAGHCATLVEATDNDPPSLIQARQAVVDFLHEMLD